MPLALVNYVNWICFCFLRRVQLPVLPNRLRQARYMLEAICTFFITFIDWEGKCSILLKDEKNL